MNLLEATTELLIFAKERSGDDDPLIREAAHTLERKLGVLHATSKRRNRMRGIPCEICKRHTLSGLLCWRCGAGAPPAVRHAFKRAVGLDGMRAATAAVLAYARGLRSATEEEAA